MSICGKIAAAGVIAFALAGTSLGVANAAAIVVQTRPATVVVKKPVHHHQVAHKKCRTVWSHDRSGHRVSKRVCKTVYY
ncbi:hypothetical protein [Rhizobium halophytocola]|uniref:Uncharacterized protein n=1 Tax=Rhizobium halophytocola TaxID=735519 RepID=A0ABS4DSE8_9HYPH|nr:hypothetical protein [Rhizobium halophytocola]MBP1848615.1 hypothetical protein [Rhizobium halophytocola]